MCVYVEAIKKVGRSLFSALSQECAFYQCSAVIIADGSYMHMSQSLHPADKYLTLAGSVKVSMTWCLSYQLPTTLSKASILLPHPYSSSSSS